MVTACRPRAKGPTSNDHPMIPILGRHTQPPMVSPECRVKAIAPPIFAVLGVPAKVHFAAPSRPLAVSRNFPPGGVRACHLGNQVTGKASERRFPMWAAVHASPQVAAISKVGRQRKPSFDGWVLRARPFLVCSSFRAIGFAATAVTIKDLSGQFFHSECRYRSRRELPKRRLPHSRRQYTSTT